MRILLLGALVCLAWGAEECRRSNLGGGYRGTQAETVLGYTCQRWDSQEPHEHGYSNAGYFADDTMDEVANNCRNPDLYQYGLWCYTTDPDTRWGFCATPLCGEDFPQCKYSDDGTEYRGILSETTSGEECAFWTDEEHHFCRNPDSREGGPWCYTNDEDNWGFCDVPFCKPSASCKRTQEGLEYAGTVSLTTTGWPCQRWDKQFPHTHGYTDPAYFPDDSLEDASMYCRNPDDGSPRSEGPWCHTLRPDVEWEYCDLPVCSDCKVTDEGREYFGSVSVTESGETCQRWDSQSPHPHDMTDTDRYPDASLDDAANYCRNPDSKAGGPWCYTTNPDTEWEYCDINECGQEDDEPSFQKVRHVVHIGIDGFHKCFVDSPLGAPNIMTRLAEQGSYTTSEAHTSLTTVSIPAWMGIECGSPTETTGASSNSWWPPWKGEVWPLTPVTGNDIPFPCVYRGLKQRDNNIHVGAIYSWKFHHALMDYGDPGSVDYEQYIDPVLYGNGSLADYYVTGNATEYLRDVLVSAPSTYTFIYFEHLDVMGHTYGWCTDPYLAYVDVLDANIGTILDTIDDMQMADEVLIFLCSDHGGLGFSHGCTMDTCMDVPLFIRGPGVKENHEFIHEVRNIDIVPTAFWSMGLQPNPWWKGMPIFEAYEDSD